MAMKVRFGGIMRDGVHIRKFSFEFFTAFLMCLNGGTRILTGNVQIEFRMRSLGFRKV